MKTLVLGTKVVEDVNTKITANYVTDYTGEKWADGTYIVKVNEIDFGINEKTYDMFALTCYNAVKAVADFWSMRDGNSWKTLKCDCVLKATDFEVFDNVRIQLPPHIKNNTNGTLVAVEHNTDSDVVSIEVEFAIKSGTDTEDPNYWVLGPATCVTPTGTEEDYTPDQDDSCPVYSYAGEQTVGPPYKIVLVQWPVRVTRWQPFELKFEIHDEEDTLVADTSNVEMVLYTSSITDSHAKGLIAFVAGEATVNIPAIRRSTFFGIIRIYVTPVNKQIQKGEVRLFRKDHL